MLPTLASKEKSIEQEKHKAVTMSNYLTITRHGHGVYLLLPTLPLAPSELLASSMGIWIDSLCDYTLLLAATCAFVRGLGDTALLIVTTCMRLSGYPESRFTVLHTLILAGQVVAFAADFVGAALRQRAGTGREA